MDHDGPGNHHTRHKSNRCAKIPERNKVSKSTILKEHSLHIHTGALSKRRLDVRMHLYIIYSILSIFIDPRCVCMGNCPAWCFNDKFYDISGLRPLNIG